MRGGIAACLALLFLAGCKSAGEDLEDCHWIGSVNPLTGGLGPVGLPLENAAKLAVQDVNRAGLVAGKRLCIATGDDRTNPERAAKVIEALVETHRIVAVNGAAASSATLEAAKAAEKYDLALVSCCSTSPLLTENKNIYRTVPSDALQGVALANYAKTVAQAQNVAIIYLDNSYGAALKDEFIQAFENPTEGRRITNAVGYVEQQSSYVDVVNSALSTTPAADHAVLIAYPVEGTQIIRDWKTSGVGQNVKWLGTDGLKDDNFALSAGPMIGELAGTAPIPNGQHYAEFEARYKAAYGGELPGIFTSNQYDAVILIALGIAAAGPEPEPREIRDMIPNLSRPGGTTVSVKTLGQALSMIEDGMDVDYSGVSGEVDLDDNGDVYSGYRVWRVDTQSNALVETTLCFRCNELMTEERIECLEETCT